MIKNLIIYARILFLIIVIKSLTACVTEKTGGFRVQPSETEAFADYIQLALNYIGLGEYDRALFNLQNARKINPESAKILYVMARMYVRKEEYQLADAEYLKALAADAGDSEIRHNYSTFLFGVKRYHDACKQLVVLVEDILYRRRSQAFEHLGTCQLITNKKEAALDSFLRAISLSENKRSKSLLELSQLYYEKRQYKEADKYMRRYRTNLMQQNRNPMARSVWLNIRINWALGNKEIAAEEGRILARLYPKSQEYQQFKNLIDND